MSSTKQQAPITDQMTMFTSISWAWRSTPLTECGDPDRDDSAATDTTSGHNSSQPLRGKIVQGKEACDMWYSEISKYDYNKAGYSNGTGHFTQIVWKSSKELGVGIPKGHDGKIYVVANYVPPGNCTGQFKNNVFPPK